MRRHLLIAGLISLALHAALLAGLMVHQPAATARLDHSDAQGAVELLMVETPGSGTTQLGADPPEHDTDQSAREAAPPSATQRPEAADRPAQVSTPAETTTARATEAPPALPLAQDSPASSTVSAAAEALPMPPSVPPLSADKVGPAQAGSQPAQISMSSSPPRAPAAAPEFNLGGTGSPSYALSFGSNVLPPTPGKHRNLPPVYPPEAARLGQAGTVVVLIHVSMQGVALDAEVVRSSGYRLLDEAARNAVLRWEFLPAMRDGKPLPFDMPMTFTFTTDERPMAR
jgi:protein TonB